MKQRLIILTLITLLALVSMVYSEITVEAYVNKTKIGTEDLLNYTIEFSGSDAGEVGTPDISKINNFANLGSSSSESQQIKIVNGKMNKSVTKSYVFTLKPRKTGNLLIPPLTFKHKSQVLTTSPIRITVIEGSIEPDPPVSTKMRSNNNSTSSSLSDNLFLIADIDKSTVYVDEPIIVTYKLYNKYDIDNLSYAEEPNFSDFWKEEIERPSRIRFTRENYKGQIFNSITMLKAALFPTKSGKLIIPPMEILVDIRLQPKNFFDFGKTKRYTIKSKPREITVKDLPLNNQPPSFSGAIGSYQLSSDISNRTLKVGESFTYTISISGTGNLQQFEPPRLPEISNLRFIDPEINTQLNPDKISGTKDIKYLVIAQEKGDFQLPGLPFTYFDINQKRYITKRTPSFNISVAEGDLNYITSTSVQSMVKREGRDIGFIAREINLEHNSLIFNNILFWLTIILFVLTIPFAVAYANERSKIEGNYEYHRLKQANKILKKYMKQATEHFKNGNQDFYPAAHNGLSNYLADKLKINRGSSSEEIFAKLKSAGISEEIQDTIRTFFTKCDEARFMPGGFSNDKMSNDYEMLRQLVTSLSKFKFRG